MATTYIVQNQSVSTDFTSDPITLSGDLSNASFDILVTCPLNIEDSMMLELQQSKDGGMTWQGITLDAWSGGPIVKGPNKGQQATNEDSGQLVANDGDQLRITCYNFVGSDVWIITASANQ